MDFRNGRYGKNLPGTGGSWCGRPRWAEGSALVPEQYSLEMEKAVRRVLDTSSAFLVEVYSFTRLCDRIFRELGGAARQAPEEAAIIW